MGEPSWLEIPEGRRIAYHRVSGTDPGIVFLGGFASDMDGIKATHLEAWARARGNAFLRFDYSGHGRSSGAFTNGSIGAWATDAKAVITTLTEGPQVLVGSSMGGWIALLMAERMPDRIAGLIGIAAAPDFTEDSMWAGFTEAQRAKLLTEGQITLPSDYSDQGYTITRRLIEDGRRHLVLRKPLSLPFTTRFLQGTADADVSTDVALKLLDHADGPDIRLTLVKGADHRFSGPTELSLIEAALEEVIGRHRGGEAP
ncbi:MAG: alpha/beta hydrolase [Pseudomonadota bacterium]